jgi:hypothetical protein
VKVDLKRKKNIFSRKTQLAIQKKGSQRSGFPDSAFSLDSNSQRETISMPQPAAAGPLDTATAVSAPAPAFEIDAAALSSYLRSNIASFPASGTTQPPPLRVLKFTHGQSNPTYLLQVCLFLKNKRGGGKTGGEKKESIG